MSHGMTRREFAATAASVAALGFGARAQGAGTKTLRFIAQSDLKPVSQGKVVEQLIRRDAFHDGEPVRGADYVASPQRWMVRDWFGQSLATAIDKMEAAGRQKPHPGAGRDPACHLIVALGEGMIGETMLR